MKYLIFRRADSALLLVPSGSHPSLPGFPDSTLVSLGECDVDPDRLEPRVAAQLERHGFAVVMCAEWPQGATTSLHAASPAVAFAWPTTLASSAGEHGPAHDTSERGVPTLRAKLFEDGHGALWLVANDSRGPWPVSKERVCYEVGEARLELADLGSDVLSALARTGHAALHERDRIGALRSIVKWAEPRLAAFTRVREMALDASAQPKSIELDGGTATSLHPADAEATAAVASPTGAWEAMYTHPDLHGLTQVAIVGPERREQVRTARRNDARATHPDSPGHNGARPTVSAGTSGGLVSSLLDFAALCEASPYPYLLIGTDYTVLHANPAYLAATGRAAEDIVHKHLFAAFPASPNDPASTNTQEVALSIDMAVATRKPHPSPLLRFAVPRDTPEGRVFDERYWSAVHTPVLDSDGEVLFVSQNAIDVTDLYRFDPASRLYFLRQQPDALPALAEFSRPQLHEAMTRILGVERNQLQTLFNQAPGFIAVLMGSKCVFDTVNEAYYQLVGHRDILGRPMMEALPELAGQGLERLFADVLETGRPIVLSERRLVIQRESSGSLEERYVDLLYQPIFGADGSVVGIFNQGHDVTEGYLARRVLAEKLDELAEARRWSALQLQLADRLRPLQNPVEIFLQSATLIGEHFKARRVAYGEYHRLTKQFVFHADYVDGVAVDHSAQPVAVDFDAGDVAIIEEGGIWVSDDLCSDPRTTGPETWPTFEALKVHAAVVVPLTRHGPAIACLFVGTATPKTWLPNELDLLKEAAERVWTAVERVRAETALRAADERKDEFLAMLAHELRNPLAPIRAAAEIQAMAPADAARVRDTSAIILRQVNHLTSLVDDLLDMSRVTRGLVSLESVDVDIKDVLADAVEQARPMIEVRGHDLAVQCSTAGIHVAGDKKRLVQVFANVLNNAAKYTPDGGRIRVVAAVADECVAVTVIDSGIGMSPEVADRAFELFAQAERTPDRAQGGLGIGLALVKRLVELHGGSATACSQGAGTGSEITIRLPRLLTVGPASPATTAPLAVVARPLRVLIVDDNTDAASTMAMLIEASGHAAVVAHEASEGLRRALAQPPDVCLLDIGLPGMDGTEMAAELRRNGATAGAVLIAVTGYGQAEDRERSAGAGFDYHLVKPVDAKRLAELLAALSRRSAEAVTEGA